MSLTMVRAMAIGLGDETIHRACEDWSCWMINPYEPKDQELSPDQTRQLTESERVSLAIKSGFLCSLGFSVLCSAGYLCIVGFLEAFLTPPLVSVGYFGQFGFLPVYFGCFGFFIGISTAILPHAGYGYWLLLCGVLGVGMVALMPELRTSFRWNEVSSVAQVIVGNVVLATGFVVDRTIESSRSKGLSRIREP